MGSGYSRLGRVRTLMRNGSAIEQARSRADTRTGGTKTGRHESSSREKARHHCGRIHRPGVRLARKTQNQNPRPRFHGQGLFPGLRGTAAQGRAPPDDHGRGTRVQWQDFLAQFELRKVALGTCARDFGTHCVHEHACVRCPVPRPDPSGCPGWGSPRQPGQPPPGGQGEDGGSPRAASCGHHRYRVLPDGSVRRVGLTPEGSPASRNCASSSPSCRRVAPGRCPRALRVAPSPRRGESVSSGGWRCGRGSRGGGRFRPGRLRR